MKLDKILLTCTFLIFLKSCMQMTTQYLGMLPIKKKQSLIWANIYIECTSLGFATDEKGYYNITILEEGTYGQSLDQQRVPIYDGIYL